METQELDRVVAALEKDLAAARKARLATIVAGSIVAVLVFIVFAVTVGKFKENIRPDTLASVAAYATRQAVKEGRPALEKMFREQMPIFLGSLRQTLVNDLVPGLRKEIEGELIKVVDRSFERSSQAFGAAVRSAIARTKAAGGTATPSPDLLAAVIAKEFAAETERRFSEHPEETLGEQYRDSKAMLEGLNQKLAMLTKQDAPKSREEALEMRFLRAWVSLLTQADPAKDQPTVVGKPDPSVQPPAAPVAPPAPVVPR